MKRIGICLVFSSLIIFSAAGETYYVGIPPYHKTGSFDETLVLYEGMLDQMQAATGDQYIAYGTRSYEEIERFIAAGKLDLALFGPVPYLKARRLNPNLTPIVQTARWNAERTALTATFTTHILVLKKSLSLRTLADLQGMTLGVVNADSTSGTTMVRYALAKAGIEFAGYFESVFFLGSHPRVTDALAAGSIDVAGTYDHNRNLAVEKHGDIFLSLYDSPPIPLVALFAREGFPADHIAALSENLLSLESHRLEGLFFDGFVPVGQDVYQDFERVFGVP